MVFVKLKGGLGNQMFQYAAGKALSEHLKTKLKIELSHFIENPEQVDVFVARPYALNIFPNIIERTVVLSKKTEHRIYKKLRNIFIKRIVQIYNEASMAFDPLFFKLKSPVILEGFFQNQDYFINFEEIIRHSFEFPSIQVHDKNFEILSNIETENSISVHVRRGDYLNNLILQYHGVCEKDYYIMAIERISVKLESPFFYFFSDDPGWVKTNLMPFVSNGRIVQGNTEKNSWKDMMLMSYCKHNILSNSSFSWWSAWLNSNRNKTVIAPKNWFANEKLKEQAKDICPDSWIRI